MRDDDVGAGLGHGARLVRVEHIGRGQQVELVRLGDHVDLEPKAHAGLLETLAHRAVEQADRREILHAGETHRLQLGEKHAASMTKRIGAVDAGEHRRVLHHRQHLAGHFLDDLVGVAIGEQPGGEPRPAMR